MKMEKKIFEGNFFVYNWKQLLVKVLKDLRSGLISEAAVPSKRSRLLTIYFFNSKSLLSGKVCEVALSNVDFSVSFFSCHCQVTRSIRKHISLIDSIFYNFMMFFFSVVPIFLVAVLRAVGILKVDQSAFTEPIRRTDTNASSHPMMVKSLRKLKSKHRLTQAKFLGGSCH